MTREEALAHLAPAHALALRLHDLGAAAPVIAGALQVDETAVAPLLEVAEKKLRALSGRSCTNTGEG